MLTPEAGAIQPNPKTKQQSAQHSKTKSIEKKETFKADSLPSKTGTSEAESQEQSDFLDVQAATSTPIVADGKQTAAAGMPASMQAKIQEMQKQKV